MDSNKGTNCDACNRSVVTKDGEGLYFIGMDLNKTEESREMYPELELGKKYFVCPVCALKAFGVKFKKGDK